MFFFPKQEYYWSFHLFLKKQETKANFPDSNSGNDLNNATFYYRFYFPQVKWDLISIKMKFILRYIGKISKFVEDRA